MRVPWNARRSNQSVLKEISPGCSLEGLMLKLKLQYSGGLAEAALTLRWSTVAFLWTSPPPVVRNLEHLHLRMSFMFAAKVSKGLSVLDQNETFVFGYARS